MKTLLLVICKSERDLCLYKNDSYGPWCSRFSVSMSLDNYKKEMLSQNTFYGWEYIYSETVTLLQFFSQSHANQWYGKTCKLKAQKPLSLIIKTPMQPLHIPLTVLTS